MIFRLHCPVVYTFSFDPSKLPFLWIQVLTTTLGIALIKQKKTLCRAEQMPLPLDIQSSYHIYIYIYYSFILPDSKHKSAIIQ